MALNTRGFSANSQVSIPVWFHGEQIGDYKADIVVNHTVVLELKAARAIEPAHQAQLLNYLRVTSFEIGLLLNFGPRPEIRRLVFLNARKRFRANPAIEGCPDEGRFQDCGTKSLEIRNKPDDENEKEKISVNQC